MDAGGRATQGASAEGQDEGVKSIREFAPLTPTLSLRERERQWWYCRLQAAQGFIGAFEALTQ
jgi:hypothetical protein